MMRAIQDRKIKFSKDVDTLRRTQTEIKWNG